MCPIRQRNRVQQVFHAPAAVGHAGLRGIKLHGNHLGHFGNRIICVNRECQRGGLQHHVAQRIHFVFDGPIRVHQSGVLVQRIHLTNRVGELRINCGICGHVGLQQLHFGGEASVEQDAHGLHGGLQLSGRQLVRLGFNRTRELGDLRLLHF